ncbi:dTMP kinase [Govanella unica]|uniref:Thymidylate kinase n=1 Tax=Govanella unica TaxID=2975056 RepID=A0A9X3TY87_9PROT|nr:dTMP kinase [Govania unica]MDA5193853.1 dTMP kinase [Govania unica]
MTRIVERGCFITFEGGEGTGKSTQIRLLADRLEQYGIEVFVTREPGGTPSGEAIRSLLVTGATDRWLPVTEALMHTAARAEHVKRFIEPALERGIWVLSDRFIDSSRAYQGIGQGLGVPLIDDLTRLAIGDFLPDLTFVLDLPVAAALPRAQTRPGNEDRYERMGHAFHERLRQAFLDIALGEPDRCRIIDAAPSIELVAERLWDETRQALLS